MRKLPFLSFLIVSMALSACKEKAYNGHPGPYFNVKKWLETESKRLDAAGGSVIRISELNGKKDSTQVKPVKWAEYFSLLLECDLDKPAQYGLFTRDSSRMEGGEILYIYKALVPEQTVREQRVLCDASGKILEWTCERLEKNVLFNSESHYFYKPGVVLQLSGTRNIRMLGKEAWATEIRF